LFASFFEIYAIKVTGFLKQEKIQDHKTKSIAAEMGYINNRYF